MTSGHAAQGTDLSRSALFTDLYELTMIQGYYRNLPDHRAVFDMFFRSQPFGGGYAVFAGLDDVLDHLERFRFSSDDIDYLRTLGLFADDFLEYLRAFRFQGDVFAMEEGSIVFPEEPLVRVHGSLVEAQLIESMLLNTINFQTLIATKSARVFHASDKGLVLEFGLRRAQGADGALSASRAAYIGGASATSNTLAGKLYGIPVKGTMAHSWVMSFESEAESFERYAAIYPDATILLIDTYSTLESGIQNAIETGKRLKKLGHSFGVRLDSGDLEYLSKQVRARLDAEGLDDATITVSNELDETIIRQLIASGSPIDSWGVGTNLVTGGFDSALTGVYKLVARGRNMLEPTIKISNQPGKITNPGTKQVYRFTGSGGTPLADLITLDDEQIVPGRQYTFNHPDLSTRRFEMIDFTDAVPLLRRQMERGRRLRDRVPLQDLRTHCIASLDVLDDTYKRLINPHLYRVSLSDRLAAVKRQAITRHEMSS